MSAAPKEQLSRIGREISPLTLRDARSKNGTPAKGKGNATLVLKLNRRAKRAFGKLRKVSLTLQVTTADAAGSQKKTKRPVTLRR